MNMTPGLRKFALTSHIGVSVGLLGSIASFLALSIVGIVSQDEALVRAAYLAMKLVAWFVIVPLAFSALLSGVIESLGTPWGLVRHYWVVAKLLLTGFATIVLLVKLQLISYASQLAAQTPYASDALHSAGIQLTVHAAGGLVVLFVPLVLSVYKPRGLTPYGARKQRERSMSTVTAPGGPAWSAWRQVPAPVIVVTILVVTFLLLHTAGSHFSAHGH